MDPTDMLFGVGGAVIGGLGVYAGVSGRLARIETRQDAHDKVLEKMDKKLDRLLDETPDKGRARDRGE